MIRNLRLLTLAFLAAGIAAPAFAQTQMQFPTTPWVGFAPGTVQCGELLAANFNVTTDQAITISVPSATYIVDQITISNPSVSMTTAAGGFYSAVSKGGVAIVASGQAYSSLTTNAANSTGNAMAATIATAGTTTAFGGPTQGANAIPTIYLSLTTGQGAAATADIRVRCRLLF